MLLLLWQATESRYEIPLRLKPRAFSSLFAQKKFDYAQDDKLTVYFAIIQKRATDGHPYVEVENIL